MESAVCVCLHLLVHVRACVRACVQDGKVGGWVHEANTACGCALARDLKSHTGHPKNLLQEDSTALGVKLVFYF